MTTKLQHEFTNNKADLMPRVVPSFLVPFDPAKLSTHLLETASNYKVTLLTPAPIQIPGYAGRVVSALVTRRDTQHVRFYDADSGRELPVGIEDVTSQGWQLGDLVMGVPTTVCYLTIYQNPVGNLMPVVHHDVAALKRYTDSYGDGIVFSDSFSARIVPIEKAEAGHEHA